MTFSEMDALVLGYCGGRSDATPALRLLYLNNAMYELAIAFFFDSLETLDTTTVSVAGTSYVTPPASNYYITSVHDNTNKSELKQRTWDWYRQQDYADSSGVPTDFCEYAGKVYLFPTPDGVYTYSIAGVKLPRELDNSNPCPFPTDWHLIVVLAASADLLFYLKDTVQAQSLRNEQLAKINSRTEVRTFRRRREDGQIAVDRKRPLSGYTSSNEDDDG